jgi:XTP/dITP diphosphohydrolase
MTIYVCSKNAGKLREFALAAHDALLPGLELKQLPRLSAVPAPEETGATFEENAALKAVYYSNFADEPVIADDSGIEADALGGAPGIYSARFAGPHATDADNNALLMERLADRNNRHGRFVCAIALAHQGRLITTVRGTAEGEITEEPRGTNGFGYDPYFFYPPLGAGFAELEPEVKWQVSHRGHAARALFAYLRTHSAPLRSGANS